MIHRQRPPAAGSSATDATSVDALNTTVGQRGSNDLGSPSASAVSESDGTASVTWRFNLANDQINFAPGQGVTQCYGVTASDSQIQRKR